MKSKTYPGLDLKVDLNTKGEVKCIMKWSEKPCEESTVNMSIVTFGEYKSTKVQNQEYDLWCEWVQWHFVINCSQKWIHKIS